MVDRNSLQEVNMLHGELSALDAVEKALAEGGVIIAMEVSPGPLPESSPDNPQPPSFGIRVQTRDIKYPQQMVDSIKQQFTQRRAAIIAELKKLGVSGI